MFTNCGVVNAIDLEYIGGRSLSIIRSAVYAVGRRLAGQCLGWPMLPEIQFNQNFHCCPWDGTVEIEPNSNAVSADL